jgi:hypothetical protein
VEAGFYIMANFMHDMITAADPESDELLFWTWARANAADLRQAAADLGVSVEVGEDFFGRLVVAVTQALVALEKEGKYTW